MNENRKTNVVRALEIILLITIRDDVLGRGGGLVVGITGLKNIVEPKTKAKIIWKMTLVVELWIINKRSTVFFIRILMNLNLQCIFYRFPFKFFCSLSKKKMQKKWISFNSCYFILLVVLGLKPTALHMGDKACHWAASPDPVLLLV